MKCILGLQLSFNIKHHLLILGYVGVEGSEVIFRASAAVVRSEPAFRPCS